MKILALALVAFAMPAYARKAPPPKGCVARGTPMFEIDHKVEKEAKMPTSTFKIYDSGAWTFASTDADGKAAEPKRGCFAGDDLTAIKKDLEVEWKVTTAKFHCMAYSAAFTDYSVHGKLVYTARVCSGKSLDDASQKALNDLEARMKTATGA